MEESRLPAVVVSAVPGAAWKVMLRGCGSLSIQPGRVLAERLRGDRVVGMVAALEDRVEQLACLALGVDVRDDRVGVDLALPEQVAQEPDLPL